MSSLTRKLLRDLAHMRGQAIAIALVIASGVATFVMSLTTYTSLAQMQDAYYERYRFAHLFASLKRAPNALAERIAEIPGVRQVQTRVVINVVLDVPDMPEPAVGRIISIPEYPEPGLNDLHLRRGRYIEPGRPGEVLVNEAFAEAHGFVPGDRVRAIINQKLEDLVIVGVALSPEYIYQIRPGDVFPDDRRYGIFWMSDRQLAPAYNMEGAFNDVAIAVTPGASKQEIIRQLDNLIQPYGGLGAYTRDDQTSHRYVSNELVQLRAMAMIPPVIFLSVAAFLLNIALNRIISTQRDQIATLKAFGYSSREIGVHYLSFALVIACAGVVLGTLAGAWLGQGLTNMYSQFFRFPFYEYNPAPGVILLAAMIGLLAATVGVLGAVRRAVRLPPAEAMRPEPPANYRPTLVERFGLQRFFPQTARVVFRELERRPLRAVLSTLGIALAIAIVVLGSFSKDLVDYLTEFQFFAAQRQDFTVGLIEPTSRSAEYGLGNIRGVTHVEPFRSVPVRLRSEYRERLVSIMGLQQERDLFRVMDLNQQLVTLPEEGLVLSESLGRVLGIRVGDNITVEVLEGHRPIREIRVAALIRDFGGTTAYMDIYALNRFMREGHVISGAFLRVDPLYTLEFYDAVKETPRIASVSSQRAALASFEDIMAENMLRMRLFNMLFGSIIAFGVVYNTARITLSERSRELATLRVIGFTRAEISRMLLGEIAVLTLVAVPFGLLAGYGLSALAVAALQTETQQFPLVVSSATFAFAVSVTLVATVVSAFVVRRRLDHLDLIAVLKSRE
ncbi:MAG: ABC transporter permease [Limisphaerales bacterium]